MKKNLLRIGLIQTAVSTDLKRNLKKTVRFIRDAARRGARVVCLQELFRTRYFPADEHADARHLAEPVDGESVTVLSRLAKELAIVIVVPVFEAAPDGRYFNTAVVIDAGGSVLGSYRKVHIPHDPFFYEKSYFEPGDQGYRIFKTKALTFAVLICYDQWFPEAARAVALLGADLIFYPTAIGYLKNDPLPYTDWLNAWITIQRGHAIASFVHGAVTNRVGTEGPVTFWGNSFVANAFGKVLRKAGTREQVLLADIDISQNARIREGWRFTKNRRPDTYGILAEPVRPDIPAKQGFHMPAEWEKHASTWLAWPEDRITFPGRLERVRKAYVEIIAALHQGEDIQLAVRSNETQNRVIGLLKDRGINLRRVHFHLWDYADVWFRDYGPTFVVNRAENKVAIVQWRFNAWGGKYPPLLKDANIPYFISERLGIPLYMPGIILEGGAIDVNGAGALLTTEQCLLNPNRNPKLSRKDLERYLAGFLGAEKVVWLKKGLAGDDTDGHIDNVARFVSRDVVVCAWEDNPRDENYQTLKANFERLRNSFEVVRLPMPPPLEDRVRGARTRLAASYANFYIGNQSVLVPAYGHANDDVALKTIETLFPQRRVSGIDCRDIIYGAGALHCITQQQPSL
jgi:agmatine deiminase